MLVLLIRAVLAHLLVLDKKMRAVERDAIFRLDSHDDMLAVDLAEVVKPRIDRNVKQAGFLAAKLRKLVGHMRDFWATLQNRDALIFAWGESVVSSGLCFARRDGFGLDQHALDFLICLVC
jgi:hypothetical protein